MSVTADKRFHTTSLEFLDFIISLVDELRENGRTTYTTDKVSMARRFLSAYSPTHLLEGFISNHQYWDNIAEKNKDFVLKDVPVLYKDVGLDVNIVILPYKSYTTDKDSCVTHEDIDIMWQYFTAMVKISCNYIYAKRQTDSEFEKEIDLSHYSEKFGFVLKSDTA